MLDETKKHSLAECMDSAAHGNIVSFIRSDLETGEMLSFQRFSLGQQRIVFFKGDKDGKLKKVKLKTGIEELEKEMSLSHSYSGSGEGSENESEHKRQSIMVVRVNGIPVKGLPIHALNHIKTLILERQQINKSKWANKRRRSKVLGSLLFDLLDSVEASGKKIRNKDILEEAAAMIKETHNKETKDETKKDKIQEMLERRFAEKALLNEDKGFNDVIEEDIGFNDIIKKSELTKE